MKSLVAGHVIVRCTHGNEMERTRSCSFDLSYTCASLTEMAAVNITLEHRRFILSDSLQFVQCVCNGKKTHYNINVMHIIFSRAPSHQPVKSSMAIRANRSDSGKDSFVYIIYNGEKKRLYTNGHKAISKRKSHQNAFKGFESKVSYNSP